MAALGDKWQITAALAVDILVHLLPTQLIYGSKTPARLPQVDFPLECYSANHWANEETMLYDHFKAQSIQWVVHASNIHTFSASRELTKKIELCLKEL